MISVDFKRTRPMKGHVRNALRRSRPSFRRAMQYEEERLTMEPEPDSKIFAMSRARYRDGACKMSARCPKGTITLLPWSS